MKVSKEWWGGLFAVVLLVGIDGLVQGPQDAVPAGIMLGLLLVISFPFYYRP
ncbi:MAG TPA: hypothetical protein VKR56_09520 [Candidatus Cybelea sp.]|nr:hypothetical protein [Candidatus Cybelea sp.]